ncbi:unnamed protein product [Cunninghamella blakesleeana]
MSNHLKRRYSIDNNNQFKKRTKILSDIPLPETYDYEYSYTFPIAYNNNNDSNNNNITTHLPPSPPVINDPATPLSTLTSIDTIPTLKRFIISTKQQVPEITTSNYTDINHLLYQLHIERYSGNPSSIGNFNNDTDTDMSMISDDTYQYDSVNAILKQAFLERHSPE